jgi:hypothetical protein
MVLSPDMWLAALSCDHGDCFIAIAASDLGGRALVPAVRAVRLVEDFMAVRDFAAVMVMIFMQSGVATV